MRLFERGRDGVRLTPVGAALLPPARRVLAEWDRAWDAAEQAKVSQRATLVAGMSTSPGRGGLLPAIRSRFTAAQPQATVKLRQVSWDDPTAGLADGTVDVAFVWLPLPDSGRFRWVLVADEPRLVALPGTHPLARREVVDFAELLDEPFLALPESAGPLRDYWLALDARDGKPPRIGAEIAGAEETYEALVDGRGVCLLAAGNAPLIVREGVVARPVRGISPSQLALAWQATDRRPLVRDYVSACRQAAKVRSMRASQTVAIPPWDQARSALGPGTPPSGRQRETSTSPGSRSSLPLNIRAISSLPRGIQVAPRFPASAEAWCVRSGANSSAEWDRMR